MDRVFLGLARLFLGTSIGLCPWEILWSSPAIPRKTLSIPPLLLGLTQSSNTVLVPISKTVCATFQSLDYVHCFSDVPEYGEEMDSLNSTIENKNAFIHDLHRGKDCNGLIRAIPLGNDHKRKSPF